MGQSALVRRNSVAELPSYNLPLSNLLASQKDFKCHRETIWPWLVNKVDHMSIEFHFMFKKSSWGCAIGHCVAKYIWYCHKNTYFAWNAIKIRHFLYLANYTLILPYQVHLMRVSSAVTPHFIQKEQRPIRNIFFWFPVTFPLFFCTAWDHIALFTEWPILFTE